MNDLAKIIMGAAICIALLSISMQLHFIVEALSGLKP